MAWARVGTPVFSGTSSGTGGSISWTGNVGDLIIVGAWFNGPTTFPPFSISDTAGFSYSSALFASGDTTNCTVVWWAIATATSNTITVSSSATPSYGFSMSVAEYSNSGTISQDGSGATQGMAGNYSSGGTVSQSAAGAGELAVAFVVFINAIASTTSSSGWNEYAYGANYLTWFDDLSAGSGSVSMSYTNPDGSAYNGADLMLFIAGGAAFQPDEDYPFSKTIWIPDPPTDIWS